jgi:hypothetical protein
MMSKKKECRSKTDTKIIVYNLPEGYEHHHPTGSTEFIDFPHAGGDYTIKFVPNQPMRVVVRHLGLYSYLSSTDPGEYPIGDTGVIVVIEE